MTVRVPSGLPGRVLPWQLSHLPSFVEGARSWVVSEHLDIGGIEAGSYGEPKHPSCGV